ncbi:E3 ubiquitin-protein ligase TRIM71-like [Ylistrum balloti]|uniref:E3 ubiquitin-protein ligase TRIM71-like n=1 Tax=Ylistrum balloti TaxID=509963 RepID=UPI0029058DF5|nr:E3 ubiquitin-protein ligase TRIM71-like [Ylistrum balloti]
MDSGSTSGLVQCSSVDTAWNDWIFDSNYAHVNEEDLAAEISKLNELAYQTGEEGLVVGGQDPGMSVRIDVEKSLETNKSKYETVIDTFDEEQIKLDSEIFGGYVSSVLQYPDIVQCPTVSREDNIDEAPVYNNEEVILSRNKRNPTEPVVPLNDVALQSEVSFSPPDAASTITVHADTSFPHNSLDTGIAATHEEGYLFPKADFEVVIGSDENTPGDSSTNPKVSCSKHPDVVAESYCKVCDELACTNCVFCLHGGHQLEPVSDAIETKKQELVEMLDILTENYIPKLHHRIISNKQFSQKYEDQFDEVMNEIKTRESKLQSLLRNTTAANIAILSKHRKQQKERSSRIEAEWDDRLVHIRDLVKEGNTMSTPGKAFQVVKELRSTLQSLDVALEQLQGTIPSPTLAISDISQDKVTELLGALTTIEDKGIERPLRLNLELHTTFRFTKNSVWALVTHGNGSAWIAAHEDSTIRLVTKTGVVLRSVTLSAKVYDITVNVDGNLLISAVHDSHIWQLSSNRDVTRFVKFKGMYPCGLFASPKGHVFVGVVGGGLRDKHANSRQFVVKISPAGKVLQRFEKDAVGNALYSLPYRIHENTNNDVCVVDWTDSAEARLVVTDHTGKLNFIYTGFEEDAHSFRPGGLTCTPAGMILLCDIYRDIIHVLNRDGQCVNLLNSQRLGGFYGPCDISLDKDGYLWVGGCKGNVQCLRYNQ